LTKTQGEIKKKHKKKKQMLWFIILTFILLLATMGAVIALFVFRYRERGSVA